MVFEITGGYPPTLSKPGCMISYAGCDCAEGLYTELDFRNEGLNMIRMQQVLDESEFFDSSQIVIPKPFMDISSR